MSEKCGTYSRRERGEGAVRHLIVRGRGGGVGGGGVGAEGWGGGGYHCGGGGGWNRDHTLGCGDVAGEGEKTKAHIAICPFQTRALGPAGARLKGGRIGWNALWCDSGISSSHPNVLCHAACLYMMLFLPVLCQKRCGEEAGVPDSVEVRIGSHRWQNYPGIVGSVREPVIPEEACPFMTQQLVQGWQLQNGFLQDI